MQWYVYSTYVYSMLQLTRTLSMKTHACFTPAQTYRSYTYSYNFGKNDSRCNYFELKCETTLVYLMLIILLFLDCNKTISTVYHYSLHACFFLTLLSKLTWAKIPTRY